MLFIIENNFKMRNYEILKSFRKTMTLQIKNGKIIVHAPHFILPKTILAFIKKHNSWIERKLKQFKSREKSLLDKKNINLYKKRAKNYIIKRVEQIGLKNNFNYKNIKITSAKTRWGSCTSKKNLNFSYRLILVPMKIIDYVIVHELCHLREMNHSKKFWREVGQIMPDYKKHDKWLKDNSHKFEI